MPTAIRLVAIQNNMEVSHHNTVIFLIVEIVIRLILSIEFRDLEELRYEYKGA